MEENEIINILDVREADVRLEKYRKDLLEKYLEYGFVTLQRLKEQGKTIDDVIEQVKTVLWYVKNERMQQIHDEFGL
jgi:hypothetical protein